MGLLQAFGGKAYGVASCRTAMGGYALRCTKGARRGQPLVEVPLTSCISHSYSATLVGEESSLAAARAHNRTGPNPHQRRLETLLVPPFRTARGCTAHRPFGSFGEWLRLTSGMMMGLSASTESGSVFSLHPFEAAAALSVLEGATLASPPRDSPQWHYLQTLPLAQFLYQGGDQGRRHHVVAVLAGDAPREQIDLFHDAHVCMELIAGNLSDALLRKYDHTEHDEQLGWMAQAALLCMRGRLQTLPVFAARPSHPSAVCEFYRPFIVPGIDMIRHSFDVGAEVNTKVYVDLARGCVTAEAFRDVRAGEELFVLHPTPPGEELEGMDGSMGLVLRYGIGAFV